MLSALQYYNVLVSFQETSIVQTVLLKIHFTEKIFRAFFRNKKLKSCNSYIISNLFYTCISNDLQKFLYCLNSHTKKKLFNIIHVCYYTSNCTCKTVMVHGQLSSNINSLETFNSMADMFLWNTDLF